MTHAGDNLILDLGSAGRVLLREGCRADYVGLGRYHYRAGKPATFAHVAVLEHESPWVDRRVVGIGVLSFPVPMMSARNRHFGVPPREYGTCLRFANANVRTISRVIVHPQFRGIGLGGHLVRDLIARCPTRYIESAARMGEFTGLFLNCGFTQLPTSASEVGYFLLDRETQS